MGATRYASVLGLGFGDCGKGHFVDALTRRWEAHTVVRFNGGAQAGHNVVTPESQHHTFSQFGAGTLVPGTHSVLADPVVVHPTALLVEAEALGRMGVHDALLRLHIDAQCRVTTPYHQAAGQLRERLRGAAAHGTCGVGFGETVLHALQHPDQVLRYGDLAQPRASAMKARRDRLHAVRETLLAEFSPLCSSDSPAAADGLRVLEDEALAGRWLTIAETLARQCRPASAEEIHARLNQPGAVIFEGAQGVLLDERRGFHPHTTWSSTTTQAVEGVAARFGVTAPIEHLGVLRAYLTRHGPGPFPTQDPSLEAQFPEPHNDSSGWQGCFRRGHPDAVLLRYGLEAAGTLSGLLISHLDVFTRGVGLRWCEAYSAATTVHGEMRQISVSRTEDLAYQSQLTELLMNVRPIYAEEPIHSPGAFLERISSVTSLPVFLQSNGPTCHDVHDR